MSSSEDFSYNFYYVSMIKFMGKPIMPPLLTEEKLNEARHLRNEACRREKLRAKSSEDRSTARGCTTTSTRASSASTTSRERTSRARKMDQIHKARSLDQAASCIVQTSQYLTPYDSTGVRPCRSLQQSETSTIRTTLESLNIAQPFEVTLKLQSSLPLVHLTSTLEL